MAEESRTRESGNFLQRTLGRLFGRMRSPQLVIVLGLLFLVDMAVPDPLPFVDEIALGLMTLLATRWRKRNDPTPYPDANKPPTKNVTPDGP